MQASIEVVCPICKDTLTISPWEAKEYGQDTFSTNKVPTELAMLVEGQVHQCFNCKTKLYLSAGIPKFVPITVKTI